MIKNIDTTLAHFNNIIEQNASTISTSDEFQKLNQVKHHIIQHNMITRDKMARNFLKIVSDELQKCASNKSSRNSTVENRIPIINAIEHRQLHMINGSTTSSIKNSSPTLMLISHSKY